MTKLQRLMPDREFPEYAFIPGKHPHPNKEGGHSFNQPEPEVSRLDPENPLENKDFLFAIDLYNHGYFWESHTWWEALWNEERRSGETADLLKALIKIGAAGVKARLSEVGASKDHVIRALEILEQIPSGKIAGFNLNLLKVYCQRLRQEIPELIGEDKVFPPLPFIA